MRPRQIEMEIKNRVAELKEEMKKQSKLKRSAYIKNYKKKKYKQKVYYVPADCDDPDRFVFEKLKKKFQSS